MCVIWNKGTVRIELNKKRKIIVQSFCIFVRWIDWLKKNIIDLLVGLAFETSKTNDDFK